MGETELSSVEGQRVMQVLDETLNATRLISCVTPDLRSRSANITDMVGPEVTDLLLAHVDLLEEYEGALAKCGGEPKCIAIGRSMTDLICWLPAISS